MSLSDLVLLLKKTFIIEKEHCSASYAHSSSSAGCGARRAIGGKRIPPGGGPRGEGAAPPAIFL
jgi:hypothetical protein